MKIRGKTVKVIYEGNLPRKKSRSKAPTPKIVIVVEQEYRKGRAEE